MTTTTVALTGFILDSNVINPKRYFTGNKFMLSLQPDNQSDLYELEHKIEALKWEAENESYQNPDEEEHTSNYTVYNDEVFDGCSIIFQTIHKPKILGDLSTVCDDHELFGKHIRALGHLKLHKGGNAYISIHEIIEAPLPEVDGFDFIDGEDDGF
jgi:hypothetical protein